MSKIRSLLVGAALIIATATSASATSLLKLGENDLFFNNFENLYDANGNYVDAATQFTRGILVGDYLMGILSVQNIDQAGTTHFYQGPTEQLSGIFLQQVTGITPEGFANNLPLYHIDFGTAARTTFTNQDGSTTDISGLLNANEMMALYYQNGPTTTVFESNGTINDDVAKATDGSKWMGLGLSPTQGMGAGYFYSHVNIYTPLNNFDGNAWAALNVMTNNTGFVFGGVNDPNEQEKGGSTLLTELYMSSELEWNPGNANGTSPWTYRSNDPAHVEPVPEPSTIILLGAGLVGLIACRRKMINKD